MVLKGSIFAVIPFLTGFVLLSGPEEASLPATPENPTIVFQLTTDYPSLKKKGEFLGGAHEDLPDDQFWLRLVEETMGVWNNVEGAYIELQVQSDENATKDPDDKVYSITTGSLPKTAAAAAHPQVEDGVINDCDIVVAKNPSDARSLAYTMLHELGHCLGLGHNHTNYSSVMGYSRSSSSLYLAPDDKAGIIYLYQDPDTPEAKELIHCGVVEGLEEDGTSVLWWLCLPLVVASFGVQRRTRRGCRADN